MSLPGRGEQSKVRRKEAEGANPKPAMASIYFWALIFGPEQLRQCHVPYWPTQAALHPNPALNLIFLRRGKLYKVVCRL